VPVIAAFMRSLGEVVSAAWHLRRPGLLLFVVVVGALAALAALLGAAAPVAIYPLL
jgi:hypothetical protein